MGHSETFINGVFYPSVTTIINAKPKPWLQAWYDKWGERAVRKTKIAGAVGTAFHSCIERYLTGDPDWAVIVMPEYPSCERRVWGMVKSWVAWAESADGEVIATELKVISHKHRYSGTLDCIIGMKQ
jgi:hypothetical protein